MANREKPASGAETPLANNVVTTWLPRALFLVSACLIAYSFLTLLRDPESPCAAIALESNEWNVGQIKVGERRSLLLRVFNNSSSPAYLAGAEAACLGGVSVSRPRLPVVLAPQSKTTIEFPIKANSPTVFDGTIRVFFSCGDCLDDRPIRIKGTCVE